MDLSVEREIRDDYVRLAATGDWKLQDIFELIDMIRAEAEAAGRDRVLVDLREVRGTLSGNIAEMDRFFAGERVARILGARIKVAVVVLPELITKFGENVAVNRGARIAVLPSEQGAMEWLQQ